jgi:hypothetical protein
MHFVRNGSFHCFLSFLFCALRVQVTHNCTCIYVFSSHKVGGVGGWVRVRLSLFLPTHTHTLTLILTHPPTHSPNVNQLKLTCNYELINANKWEMLLTENCSKLRILELVFSHLWQYDILPIFTYFYNFIFIKQ